MFSLDLFLELGKYADSPRTELYKYIDNGTVKDRNAPHIYILITVKQQENKKQNYVINNSQSDCK